MASSEADEAVEAVQASDTAEVSEALEATEASETAGAAEPAEAAEADMAPPKPPKQGGGDNPLGQYKYANMSNLVLQSDKRFVTRRGDEASGDPESMAGRISLKDMGSRGAREAAPVQSRKQEPTRKRKRAGPVQTSRAAGILSQADMNVEGLRYRPRTNATKDVYDLISTNVKQKMGSDYPLAVTASATDSILEFLKDENLKDSDKKKEIDDILGITSSNKEFNELVNLGKKITDYDVQEEEETKDVMADDDDGFLDEELGVAVDFGHDDGAEEEARPAFEVREEDDISDDGLEIGTLGLDDEPIEPQAEGRDDDDRDDDMIATKSSKESAHATDDGSVPAYEIDAFWLQRQVGKFFNDPLTQAAKTKEAENIMSGSRPGGQDKPLREIENDLMELFDYEQPEIVSKLVKNKDKIVWMLRLQRASGDNAQRTKVEEDMVTAGHGHFLSELRRDATAGKRGPKFQVKLDPAKLDAKMDVMDEDEVKKDALVGGLKPRKAMNLEDLKFDEGRHLMTNQSVKLPAGSTKRSFKGYEEIHVPAPKKKQIPGERPLIPTSDLPAWAQTGFGSSKSLNRIQTECYASAFEGDGNMLICAPTGSGKTNVAMLAMLREIGKHRDPTTGKIDLDAFKIIYVAPLKALVQEQVGNFGARLKPYGITVSELTGDHQLTKQQITDTQLIVTTPEKWDIITRKATETSYTNLVRLVCIDEIHLLHDDRGPVIESIVSRAVRRQEQTGDSIRLVGLSATLPNYRDVAAFLRVDTTKDLYHFDASFRPCPLKQEFIGVTDKKAIKQLKAMNDICYAKVLEQVGQNKNQMLIFVHSRKETAKTAKHIRDKAIEEDTIGQIQRSDAASLEILKEEAQSVADSDLKDILPYGFGIHHAGMTRADRTAVEDLFADGSIQVLVCTATLAWGVNLPAHTVIIKGTQVYSPERGTWIQLNPQDVLQALGRAGRPQYDTFGEGIIITTQSEIQYWLSVLNQQLPIESQLVSQLVDRLNAEIVLGNVRTRDEGVDWLGYTYLFVRMLRSPALYRVGADYDEDETLEQMRVDLIHSAAVVLAKGNMVKYDEKSGRLQSMDLGRIASHYYITHNSMSTYNANMSVSTTALDVLRMFAMSDEFKYIPVRQDEKLELARLLNRVPVPIKETIDEPACKINVLLQVYISGLGLEGFALMADMVYVTQNAGRLLRAIFEIALKRGLSEVALDTLIAAKTAEKRMWPVMSPLRQFPSCPIEVIHKAERSNFPWAKYFDLDPPRMGELLGMPKFGRTVCELVKHFPRLALQVESRPITRSTLHVQLTLTPKFEWNDELHGRAESWWIIVTDCDGEDILYQDRFVLNKKYAISPQPEHIVDFTVTIAEPISPVFFINVVSDRWLSAETKVSLPFFNPVLPEKFPPHTPLLDVQPVAVQALKVPEYVGLYSDWPKFNRIQTQTFNTLFETNDSVFVGAPTGSGKTVCAELALLRHFKKAADGKAVYLAPFQEQIDVRMKAWQKRLGSLAGGQEIVKLTGDTAIDLKLLEKATLVLATPAQWNMMSKGWQRRKSVQSVKLMIADDLHMLGEAGGYAYETVISRAQTIKAQLENSLRIVGLSVSLSNARDLGEWMGAGKHSIYNFSPSTRPIPLNLHLQTFSIPHFPSLMIAMTKPTYQAILQHAPSSPTIIFVPNRKQVRKTAQDLLEACVADGDEDRFLHTTPEQIEPVLARVKEASLRDTLAHGITYFHEGLNDSDKRIAESMFTQGAAQVLIVSRESCWEVQSTAHLVIIMGAQYYLGREHRYIDYRLSEVLQMLGKAGRPGVDESSRGILMCLDVKRNYYKKFLGEALPIESQLQSDLHAIFMTEISSKTIESSQQAVDWMTYTYFFRRIQANPLYYEVTDTSQEGMNSYLSDQVEQTLNDLSEAKMIELDEDDDEITVLNPAMIASHHDISFTTMGTLLLSLKRTTKLKGLLEIVTAATEFEDIPIRRHEDGTLLQIYNRVPVKLADGVDLESPHFKAFVLLQAHFSRMKLPTDLAKDQDMILRKVLSILGACVDVLSSEGHLNAVNAIEMTQMVVQAVWDRDSPLKQIPHFEDRVLDVCKKFGIKDVTNFQDAMDPDENPQYGDLVKSLNFSHHQLADAAAFVNDRYPNLELEFELEDPDNLVTIAPAILNISISRQLDDGEQPNLTVHAPFYPVEKMEAWYIVVGEESTRTLLAIKRVWIHGALKTKMEVPVPEGGVHELTVFLMSDSYVGADQAPTLEVFVAEGTEDEAGESGMEE